MAWRNVKLHFLIPLYMWICSQASFEVDVNCWWNQALHVDPNVSVVCHTSAQGRANSCDLCQIYVITPGQRHLLPSTCASTKETLNFSIATKHTGHIRCVCNGNMVDTCNVTVREGYPPSPPSRPICTIEDLYDAQDIHCSWTKSNEPMIPTIYTLHWQDCFGDVYSRESDEENAIIKRDEYIKSTDITAWVTAENVLGSALSEESVFNTGHIVRPGPPNNITHTFMPLVIDWNMDCDTVEPLDKSCQVQYRAHTTHHPLDWIQEDDFQSTFPLEDSQPFTLYSFRVRCHCGYEEKVMSEWSSVYSVRTPPAAPVGQLDVWSDCASNSDNSSCNIYWKEMPLSQARGEISSYIVTLKLKNGTEIKRVTRQRRDTGSQHRHKQYCLQLRQFTVKMGVMGVRVFVSANTSMGMSDPTFMPFPLRGQTAPEVNLSAIGENQTLQVSWHVHPQFTESVLEYVVQYVSVVPHHPCLNWVRVNRTKRSVTITGDFRNYTAYNVSLFAVFNNHSTFLKSAIAYTLQGIPPEVPQFHVKSISHSSVILMWSPIPVHESKGVILHYLVGIDETESNVSSDKTSMQLSDLQPCRQYQAWVSAVSTAGEGKRSVTTFSTTNENRFVTSILLAVFIPLMLVFAFIFLLLRYCSQKIPDPLNSKSFKHVNFQHTWPWLSSPTELTVKISELEIVENLHPDTPSPPSEIELEKILIDVKPKHFQVPNGLGKTNEGTEKWLEDSEESNRGNISKHDSWKKEYSEMVDTDEEEDDGSSGE
uniref:Interleukin-12 receptor subunit beta-2-like X1 n=1 Tax=Ctenopharyngodon idella TaxID=7959 RepID=A0A0G3Y517_CTEID|nr:interleukin-12 receptor subunit beta-2-like X1 [Ctenopharyngodon idella]